ncbi:MAG: hypothetical protein KGI41_03325, partial [Patescibacteria group bacterium]|nr:hypothetical protein [Patescibacteria group bacterium]
LMAVFFFIIAAAVAAYFLFSGNRSVSTDNLQVSVQGPTSVSGGDTLPLSIVVENKNPAAITNVTLTVDFPSGTRTAGNVLTPYPRYSDSLGDLTAGGRAERSVQAVVFGAENQAISLPITIQYQTSGSSAVFVKQTTYDFTISTSPLSVSVDALTQVVSGQPLTLKMTVHSNATTPLSNVALDAIYPFGFSVASTTPGSSGGLFTLGTLNPGDHRDLYVSGTLSGTDGEQKVFHFTAGTLESATSSTLGVAYTQADTTVNITQPFLAVTMTLDQSGSEPAVITAGTPVNAKLTWTNTLTTPILDGEIDVALAGLALDPAQVHADSGFYRSADTTVVFNRDTDPALQSINPGASGTETFTFTPKTDMQLSTVQNPTVTLSLSMSGRRVNETQVPEQVSASLVRHARVATTLALTSDAVRTVGPFTNSGPWPPTPGTPTTYTVRLTATNSVNSVANGTVTFELPSYVTYSGAVSPADGSLAYNDVTRTFTWNLGELPPGTGAVNPPRSVAFQVSFMPSTSQRGTSPALILTQTLTGFDRFVQQSLTSTAAPVTIRTSADPAYTLDMGRVQ